VRFTKRRRFACTRRWSVAPAGAVNQATRETGGRALRACHRLPTVAPPPLTDLARISHTLSAADAECGPSASLRSFGLLDVVSTTPSSASRRAPRIRATLCVLATRGCEKCGLDRTGKPSFRF
jgi:hypothetical protein